MFSSYVIRGLSRAVVLAAVPLVACDDGARVIAGSDLAAEVPANADPDGSGLPPPAKPAAPGDEGKLAAEGQPANPLLSPDIAAGDTRRDAGVLLDAGEACAARNGFTPRKSTVYILADRSGTMFQPLEAFGGPPPYVGTPWDLLRSALLPVLPEFQNDIRFAFAAVSAGVIGACPEHVSVPPALQNADAIASVYATLELGLVNSGIWRALDSVALELWSDSANTEPHILFLNDGDADYCDDGNAICPPDSVIAALQRLHAGVDRLGAMHPPIPTLVAGVASSPSVPGALQAYANAGAGLPVLPVVGPAPDANATALFDQCSGLTNWSADLVAAGKPIVRGQTVANYATTSGSAPVLPPEEAAFREALAALRSCTLELAAGAQLDVASDNWVSDATISLDAELIPNDSENGWHVASPTTLEFEGAACDAWRASSTRQVQIDLPCTAYVTP